jgi:hypothetical protein
VSLQTVINQLASKCISASWQSTTHVINILTFTVHRFTQILAVSLNIITNGMEVKDDDFESDFSYAVEDNLKTTPTIHVLPPAPH